VALAGATGLVGEVCTRLLAADARVQEVLVLLRRPAVLTHPKLQPLLVDFAQIAAPGPGRVDAAICALGTTMAKAGSKAAFRAVDHDAVVAFASWAKAAGVTRFVLVSSVGADPQARSLYLRVKGEVERSVAALGFASVVALRPGLLLGARRERRMGEAVAQQVLPWIGPLLRGPLARYRAVEVTTVAAAAVRAALDADTPTGLSVWENPALIAGSG